MRNLSDHDHDNGAVPDKREVLEYVADLLDELQAIAEREGCSKLRTMLAMSRAEAVREALKS